MKNILIILLIFMALTAVGQEQIIFDEYDNPIPFSLTEQYKNLINYQSLEANFTTKKYDNDSLLNALNPSDTLKFRTIILLDTSYYDLMDKSAHFDLGHGNLYVCKLFSPTARELTIFFKAFDLPKGAVLSFFEPLNDFSFPEERGAAYDLKKDITLRTGFGVYGNEFYVEYYEPKEIKNSPNVMIGKLNYGAADFGFTKNEFFKKKSGNLKSGYYGTSQYDCGNKFPCSSVSKWEGVSRSTVYMEINYPGGKEKASGVFLNNSSGYSSTSKPFILTAGHAFVEGVNGDYTINVYAKYEDHECNENKKRGGIRFSGATIVEFGEDSNAPPKYKKRFL